LPLVSVSPQQPIENRVFIVHGTDHEPANQLKAILKDIGIKPIILQEQPSKGMTIIEKLEEYSDVGFAFIILTPDDNGFGKTEFLSFIRKYVNKANASLEEIQEALQHFNDEMALPLIKEMFAFYKDRARQNVVLELGYFIGRLGRSNVCCLYKGNIELPSDIHGLCYLHFNKSVNEVKSIILEELKAANYKIV
jgi:predicted nucleotide-binding protein